MNNQEDVDFYQPLFNLMFDEHRMILTQTEMDDIIVTVKKMFNEGKEDAHLGHEKLGLPK